MGRRKKESLTERIVRWRGDFPAFCREVLWIKTKEGTLVRFELNKAQMRFWLKIKEEIDAGRPVRAYILKARQLGFSTVIKGLEYWLDTLHSFRNSLTVSHSLDSASELFSKHSVFYSMAPAEARPARKRSNRKEMRFERDPSDDEIAAAEAKGQQPDIGLQSSLMVQTADNPHLGTSFTLHFVHLSEFARYEKIRRDVQTSMAGLMAAVPKLALTFVLIETTAYGLGYAKDFWDKQDNGFLKIFVSWVADESYRLEHWQRELPEGVASLDDVPDGPYGDEVEAAGYVRDELVSWYEEESADPDWLANEILCRMAWRRVSIRVDHQGSLDLFRQEYPLHAEEAFLTTGDHVFDTRKLSDMRDALLPEDPISGLRSEAFPPKRYRLNRKTGEFFEAKFGPLRVYEQPKDGTRYVMGADVSEGVSHGDASAAVVLSLPDLKQVAVYRTGYRSFEESQPPIDPDDFADVLNKLGRMYNSAYACVEVNGPGFATNLKLGKVLRYPFIYRREVFDAKTRTVQKKYGWHSNKATKNVLITDLRGFIRDDELVVLDIATLDELNHYVKSSNGQLGAAHGHHDDLVIATALAIQMAKAGLLGGSKKPMAQVQRGPTEGTFDWWLQQSQEARGSRQWI